MQLNEFQLMINKSKRKFSNFNVKYQNHIIPNTSNNKLSVNYNTEVRRSKEEFELQMPEPNE